MGDDDQFWTGSKIKADVFNDTDDEIDNAEFMGTSRGKIAQLSRTIKPDVNMTLRSFDDTIVDEGSKPGGSMSARFRPPDPVASIPPPAPEPIQRIGKRTSLKDVHETEVDINLSPQRMVWKIILGQPYSLDIYKSKQQKLALLDYAIETHDGNAITAIILYIKNSLKKLLFHQILREKPDALHHYIAFLKSEQDYNKLSDILSMVGRTEEVAMLNYKLALRKQHQKTRIAEMNKCYTNHFANDPLLEHSASLLIDHISLLERQAPIDASDELVQRNGTNEIFQRIPKSSSLINSSVITTLYYCCLYHYGLTENHLASPHAIRKVHHLSDKQFVWTAAAARAKLQRWTDIDSIMSTKTLFGAFKIKFLFNPEPFIELLKINKASREVLSKYISSIDDAELKLKLAKKCECHQLVVELLTNMKDRVQLELYKSKLLAHSTDRQNAQDALNSSTIRWKN